MTLALLPSPNAPPTASVHTMATSKGTLATLKRQAVPPVPPALKKKRPRPVFPQPPATTHAAMPTTSPDNDKSCRLDSSLALLTRKFVHVLKQSPDGILDLNIAAHRLHVQKRRIYDITNVLEGIGIIEKKSKNNVTWCRQDNCHASGPELKTLQSELLSLQREEQEIDHSITTLKTKLLNLVTGDRSASFSYVTHQDVKSIPGLSSDTLIAIKAPTDTELEVPGPDEGMPYGERRFQVLFKSSSGPIDCLLISQGETTVPTPSADLMGPPQPALDAPAVVHSFGVYDLLGGHTLSAPPITGLVAQSPSTSVLLTPDGRIDNTGCLQLSLSHEDDEFCFMLEGSDLLSSNRKGIADLYEEVMTAPGECVGDSVVTSVGDAELLPLGTQLDV